MLTALVRANRFIPSICSWRLNSQAPQRTSRRFDGADGLDLAGSYIRNNVLSAVPTYDDPAFMASSGFTFVHNDFHDAGFSALPGPGNITVDPRFVDAAGGDFHLGADSLCVDAGEMLFAVPVDYDQVPRSRGGAPDLGAYERP